MALSNPKSDTLYDPIRKKWVDKTPEELIRQKLVRQMIDELGYPRSLIAIEKELAQLPHLTTTQHVPKRRADILVFAKNMANGELFPLLMIECKAIPLLPKFAQQVIGYNTFVGAQFVALANDKQIVTGRYDAEAGLFRFTEGLPPFSALKSLLH